MANVTITTSAVFIDQVWSPELNRAIQYDVVVAALFDDKSALVDQHANTINLPSRHNLTASAKAASTALTPQAITETQQQFVLPMTNGHRAIAQMIEDIAEIQSRYDIRSETTIAGAYALARQMDVDAAGLFAAATNSVGTNGAELTDDNLIQARTLLRNQAAPRPWYIVVPPATYSGFLKLEKFTNMLYVGQDEGGTAVEEARVGKIYGADVYESQLLSGTAPNATGAFWSKTHYFKAIQRQPTTHTWYSPLDLSWIVSMDCIYGMFERMEADEAAAATTNSSNWAVKLLAVK
ncbi:MAG TPA: hypothetical protein VFB50_00370 [Chloroflexota bacterium]|nr:hypothetical protein [Chloroflexota bacterium]